MFYHLTLTKDLDIHPKYFGKNLRDHVQQKLFDEVQRK